MQTKAYYNMHMPEEKRENFFTELLKFACIALAIVLPVRLFIAQPFIVSGASMVPTFESGEYLIIDELSYRLSEPMRGDVVIFRYPKDTTEFFIKRIIGLPGEVVTITQGIITVEKTDGTVQTLTDQYVTHAGNGGNQHYIVPSESYFVLGDNRPESSDSRTWGFVPRKNIVGKTFVRLLPLQSIELFPGTLEAQTL